MDASAASFVGRAVIRNVYVRVVALASGARVRFQRQLVWNFDAESKRALGEVLLHRISDA